MEVLPDDVLVEVLQWVDVPDLFALRLVCKRFVDLALDRDVWRHRKVGPEDSWLHAHAALRLVPCMGKLHLNFGLSSCRLSATRTTCAVEELELTLTANHTQTWTGTVEAAPIVLRQEGLGRLKSVQINFPDNNRDFDFPWYLLSVLASMSVLEKITIRNFPYIDIPPCFVAHCLASAPPSLLHFHCKFAHGSQNFVQYILKRHAATLESVRVDNKYPIAAHWTALLGGLSNLRSLHCPLLLGMEALVSNPALEAVILDLPEMSKGIVDAQAADSAVRFLRSATQLRDVALWTAHTPRSPGVYDDRPPCVRMVEALIWSGESQLRSLTIRHYSCWSGDAPLRRMVGLLTALPDLQQLKLQDLNGVDRLDCLHAWLHRTSLNKLMLGNTQLHLEIMCRGSIPQTCQRPLCHFCQICEECRTICTRVVCYCNCVPDKYFNQTDFNDDDVDGDEEGPFSGDEED